MKIFSSGFIMVKQEESQSEPEGTSHAPEPRFRVRVCMEQFYSAADVRARAYVCVSPRRRVRWLARRLRRLFALPPLRLLSRGYLLPPQEPLALLQPDDPVDCVPDEPDVGCPQRCDKEPDDSADARDVDSVEEVQVISVEEPQRSPSPVRPDDLTETKRQALMMLEQLCSEPAAERAAGTAPRARRRRVRRRRRVPPVDTPEELSLQSGGSAATDASEEPPDVIRQPEALAMVLRNNLQPRAPRVVHSLTERINASFVDTLFTGIVVD